MDIEALVRMMFEAKKRQDYDTHWADWTAGSGKAQTPNFYPTNENDTLQSLPLDFASMPESTNIEDRRMDPMTDYEESFRREKANIATQFRLRGNGRYLQEGRDENGFYGPIDE